MIRIGKRGGRSGGFTLLELMLAIVITGLVLATVYGALSRTTATKEIAEERAELFSNGRQAVLRMAGDIEAALPPTSGDRIYFRGTGSGGGTPSLEFVIMNRGGYGANRVRPGRVLVAYSLAPLGGKGGGAALVREEYLYAAMLSEADGVEMPTPGEGEDSAPVSQATYLLECPDVADELNLPGACTRVTSMNFRYYDDVVRDWRDEWDSTQDAAVARLPAAVEIALRLADKDGVEQEFHTIVDLPLARGQPTPEPSGGAAVAGQPPPAGRTP